jgi:hypothetical protein
MKRIVPPKPLEIPMAAPKEPLKEGELPPPPKTLTMAEFLLQAVMAEPAWLQTIDANSLLAELLDRFEDSPHGPWDVTDAAQEFLLTQMKGVQNNPSTRIWQPKILRFYTRMMSAVFTAKAPPAEKPDEKPSLEKPALENGAAAAQA